MSKPEKREKSNSSSNFVTVKISLPFPLLQQFDEEIERRGYTRSEAVRSAMRDQLERWTGRRL